MRSHGHDSPKPIGWDGRRHKVWTSQSSRALLMTAQCAGKWSSASRTVQRLSLFSSLREQMLWASCYWFPEFAHRGKSIWIPAVMGLDGEMRVMMIMMMRRNLWDSYDLNWLRLWSCFIFWLRVFENSLLLRSTLAASQRCSKTDSSWGELVQVSPHDCLLYTSLSDYLNSFV